MSSPRPFAADSGWERPGAPSGGDAGVQPAGSGSDALLRALLEALNLQTPLLEAILLELQEQSPQGYVVPVTHVLTTTVPTEVPFNPPLFSLGITNDGPGVIQYRIPNRGSASWVSLFPTEVMQFNFIKHKIVSIGLTMLVAGGATTVRLVGIY